METNLVYANGAVALTNSILVAKKFGKEHKHVLDAIRELVKGCAENSADPMFEETAYVHPQNGQEYPMFIMNRDGFTLLAMGFTGEKALRFKLDYIKAFNAMEETIKNPHRIPQTLPEALRLAADKVEENERLLGEIEEQQKLLVAQSEQIRDLNECNAEMRIKVSYFDQILASKSTVTTTQIAQDYGMSAKKFNIELRNLKIQRKVGGQWILYAPYNTMGYVHSETFVPEKSTTGKVVMTTKWTQKGRLFLYETLKRKDILPLIERRDLV